MWLLPVLPLMNLSSFRLSVWLFTYVSDMSWQSLTHMTLNWRDSSTSTRSLQTTGTMTQWPLHQKIKTDGTSKKVGLVSNKSDAPQRTTMSNSLSAQEFRPHGRANNHTKSNPVFTNRKLRCYSKIKENGMVKRMNACFNFLTWMSLHDPDMDIFLILGIRTIPLHPAP